MNNARVSPICLAQLRARIAALENPEGQARPAVLPFEIGDVDAILPWGGLPQGALHEILLPDDDAADGPALGFAAVLLGRLAAHQDRPVLWVAGREDLYAPGLALLGLPAERLLLVHPGRGGGRAARPGGSLALPRSGRRRRRGVEHRRHRRPAASTGRPRFRGDRFDAGAGKRLRPGDDPVASRSGPVGLVERRDWRARGWKSHRRGLALVDFPALLPRTRSG